MDTTQRARPSGVILFDGECTLCSRAVRFILMRDRAERFQFASLQSEAARRLLQNAVGVPERLPDSVILIEQGQVYTRSTAALRIARRLCGPWPLAYLFILVPAIIRDTVYDLIARNRFRLFGRQSACLVPTPALRDRFL